MKVLIVDDSPQALEIAKARLAKEGLDIACAGDGQAGLKKAHSETPDLILLDVDMPGLSGFDVCKQLKSDPSLSMIPIIFLTGSDLVEDKVRGLDMGAVDYVTKPFDAFELRARVRAALRTKRLQDLLVQFSHVDPLTELWNRRALMDRIHQEWNRFERSGGVFSAVILDIDHFKKFNDTYGHHVGDEVLRLVAMACKDQARQNDYPARYGGEEFVILVTETDAYGAAGFADRTRIAIQNLSLTVGLSDVAVTASFGVADSTMVDDPGKLIPLADEAMYRAKSAGRNRVEVAHTQPAHSAG